MSMRVNGKRYVPAKSVDGEPFTSQRIQTRLRVVSDLIYRSFDDWHENRPIFVCVLKGAFILYADLVRKFGNMKVPDPTIGFVKTSSYIANRIQADDIEVTYWDVDINVSGSNVVLIDDICETGRTLKCVKEYALGRGAASVKSFTLLDKPNRRACDIELDWAGFEVPSDLWAVGYGMDDNHELRTFNNIMECVEE